MSSFQSYLIVSRLDVREKTEEILKTKGLEKIKVSPDIFIISPKKTSISIDEIRNLKNHIFQKPLSLPYKYIIIEEAHKLTIEAQNSLLKILEEPPKSAIIILEAKDKFSFLPTILSRVLLIENGESKKPQSDETSILDYRTASDLLKLIPEIDNSQDWLEKQMIILTHKLQESIKNSDAGSSRRIANALKLLAQTKKMIQANINPKFALANLVFNLEMSN